MALASLVARLADGAIAPRNFWDIELREEELTLTKQDCLGD